MCHCCEPSAFVRVRRASETSGRLIISKGPYYRNQDGAEDQYQQIERNAQFHVVAETIAAGPLDQKIGLISDGCRKAGTGAEAHRHNKGSGVDTQPDRRRYCDRKQ